MARRVEEITATYTSRKEEHLPVEPVALSADLHAELYRGMRRLTRLAAVMAQRLAPTPAHFAHLLGRPVESVPLLPDHWLPAHREVVSARPDCIVSNGRVRVLELNCHSALGGLVRLDRLTRAYLTEDPGRWEGYVPFASRLQSLLDVAASMGATSPRLAILGATRGDPGIAGARYFSDEADFGRAQGAEVDFVDVSELDDPDSLAGYDVLLRVGVSDPSVGWDVQAPAAQAWLAEHRLGDSWLPGLVVSDTSALLADKAVLHHLSVGDGLSAEEKVFCERHLPWTRLLCDEPTTAPDGTRVKTAEYVLAGREGLVAKPCAGSRGRDVIFGASTPPEEWVARVSSVLVDGSRWIVQQVVESDLFATRTVDPSGEVTMEKCAPVLSPALFGDHNGGVLARYASPLGDRIVSVAHGCVLSAALVRHP